MVQPLVIKFAGLIIKTLTKPLANQIKSKAAGPGWIREACLRYGRLHHNIESRAALRLAGHDAKSVKPVADESAVAIGATVFSETFIFATAAAILAFELQKKSQDDEIAKEKKDAAAAKDRRDLEQRFQAIETELQAISHVLRETRHELDHTRKELNKKKGSWI